MRSLFHPEATGSHPMYHRLPDLGYTTPSNPFSWRSAVHPLPRWWTVQPPIHRPCAVGSFVCYSDGCRICCNIDVGQGHFICCAVPGHGRCHRRSCRCSCLHCDGNRPGRPVQPDHHLHPSGHRFPMQLLSSGTLQHCSGSHLFWMMARPAATLTARPVPAVTASPPSRC